MGAPATTETRAIDLDPVPSRGRPTDAEEAPTTSRRTLGYPGLQRLLTALVSGAFLVMLLAGQYFSPATSDSVAQQNMLKSVLEGHPRDLVVPSDTWWLHFPIYLLSGLVPDAGIAHLLDVLLTNAVLLVGLLVFTRTYLHRVFPGSRLALVAAHLCGAWFLGLAVYIPQGVPVVPTGNVPGMPMTNEAAVTAFMTPNHRNMETGIALLLLAGFAWWASQTAALSRRRQVPVWLGGAAVLGATTWSDPYFLFTLGG